MLDRLAVLFVVAFFAFAIYMVYMNTIAKLIVAGAVVVSLIKAKMDWKIIEELKVFVNGGEIPDSSSETSLVATFYLLVMALYLAMMVLVMVLYPIVDPILYVYYASLLYLCFLADRNEVRKLSSVLLPSDINILK